MLVETIFTCCKLFATTYMFTNVWFIPSMRSFMHLKVFRKQHGQEVNLNKVQQRLRAHLNFQKIFSCTISPSDGEQQYRVFHIPHVHIGRPFPQHAGFQMTGCLDPAVQSEYTKWGTAPLTCKAFILLVTHLINR